MADKQVEQILRDLSDLRGYVYQNVDKIQSAIKQSELTIENAIEMKQYAGKINIDFLSQFLNYTYIVLFVCVVVLYKSMFVKASKLFSINLVPLIFKILKVKSNHWKIHTSINI